MVNRKRYSRTMSIVIAVAMVFSVMAFMPEDVSAAAKKPGKVTITRAAKLNQMIKVTWKKTKGAPAYQVQYRMSGKKWKTLKKSVKGTRVIAKKLKKGKRYSFRVRTVSRIQGTNYYGKWTKVKTVRAK